MAKIKQDTTKRIKPKVKRPGVHAKSKTSKLKSSKNYKTAVGRFSFQHLNSPYYSFGIERIEIEQKQFILIASKEKALCDKIILTPGILLRSVSQTQDFLLEDLRIDDDALKTLNCEIIETWIDDAPKKSSLKMLLKTLEAL